MRQVPNMNHGFPSFSSSSILHFQHLLPWSQSLGTPCVSSSRLLRACRLSARAHFLQPMLTASPISSRRYPTSSSLLMLGSSSPTTLIGLKRQCAGIHGGKHLHLCPVPRPVLTSIFSPASRTSVFPSLPLRPPTCPALSVLHQHTVSRF